RGGGPADRARALPGLGGFTGGSGGGAAGRHARGRRHHRPHRGRAGEGRRRERGGRLRADRVAGDRTPVSTPAFWDELYASSQDGGELGGAAPALPPP